jgi:hypothetical protein
VAHRCLQANTALKIRYKCAISGEPTVTLTMKEATGILTALAYFSGMRLGGTIDDRDIPEGLPGRLGVEAGAGAAHAVHVRIEDLIQAIRRDLDRLV